MLCSGVVLSGRYRLDERVATGGMGDVWRATDLLLDREVAVKILLPSLLTDPSFIARFRAEARMMASLLHPGIVRVYDCGEDPDAAGGRADYLVMEFVHGEPLHRRIEAAGRLEVTETLSVVAQAADALHAAHTKGIVHRDVKPSNLLVQADGSVLLVDFGVARSTSVTSITSTNGIPGTALYMAPEQAAGRPVSAATDIYALGAVTYCCLAGAPPFTGDTPLEVAVKHLDEQPAPLPDDVPAPVVALVQRALAKDPADRYPTAAAFAEAVRAVAGPLSGSGDRTSITAGATTALTAAAAGPTPGSDTLTDLPPVVGSAPPRSRTRRATVVSVAVAALLGLAGVAVVLNLGNSAPPTTDPASPSAPAPSTAADKPTSSSSRDTAPTDRNPGTPGTPSPSATAVPTESPAPSNEPSTAPTGQPTDPPASNGTTAAPTRTSGPSTQPDSPSGNN
ncbi:serine/threonine-protein kinase [Micromonospora sonneratiae]|uniref:non-specific serine/threonine protein kinase n=1 Tax=Micromonospora sonneratiae TaxID=1184706 RepID=A0ABW3Y7A3_9ACTN